MDNAGERSNGVRPLIQFFAGLFLGPTIGGAALALLSGDDSQKQIIGAAIFAFCAVIVLFLFLAGEWLIDKRAKNSLTLLSDSYVSSLSTTGQLLAARLDGLAQKKLEPGKPIRLEVMKILVDDLRRQGELFSRQAVGADLGAAFGKGIAQVTESWQYLAEKGAELDEGVPAGANPDQL